jgi:hypothetical protein
MRTGFFSAVEDDSMDSMDDGVHERSDRTWDRDAVSPEAAPGRAHPRQQDLESARRESAAPGLLSDGRAPLFDRVADASDDSFPASDPPAWTGLHAGAPIRT